jgi:Xaa-Pro dipeptidase
MSRISELDKLFSQHFTTLEKQFAAGLERAGCQRAVIASGTVRKRIFDDIPYPFKVNPHFNAWVPLTDRPGAFLVIEPGRRPQLLLHTPADFWHKVPTTPDGGWTAHFDIREFADADKLQAALPGNGEDTTAFLGEQPPRAWKENPAALLDYLHFHRAWKSEYELACLREANRLGARAHVAAREAFLDGANEFEIHQAFCTACGHTQDELPYPAIIALNEHGATLHYDALERQTPEAHRSFLIDAGAAFRGYASDITRTWSFADEEFDALILAVDRLQQSLCSQLRPGTDYVELHEQAHLLLAEILADRGFVKMMPDLMVESGITRTFFPHGLGHYIGLQVHDTGGLMCDDRGGQRPRPQAHPFLRLTRTVEADQVMTIEPGLYFIDSLLAELKAGKHAKAIDWKRVDRFRPFGGIRIEDDVRVTASGVENLTRHAFAELSPRQDPPQHARAGSHT